MLKIGQKACHYMSSHKVGTIINIENKNLKYFNTFKKEKNLFIQEIFILKDKRIK